MGCRKLTYYEKPASPLRVLPENDELTVIVVYSIRYDNGKVAQGWLLPDPAEQFHNPYLAMGNNPVMYVDPDGEFVDLVAGLLFQGLVGGLSAKENGGNFWKGFAIGTVTAGIGMAASSGINTVFGSIQGSGVISELGYAASNGIVGGLTEKFQGGKFATGFANTALSSYSTGGYSSAKANKEFENSSRKRWTKYWRGNLKNVDSYFGGGYFETGLASGDFVWDNYAPDWSWYNPVQPSGINWYTFAKDHLDLTIQGEVTIGAQAGGGYNLQGLGPNVELNLANLQLYEINYNINNGIRDSYVGENGVFHVSQRATVLVGEAYQSFDTRGSGYFNHDFGGSAFGIGYSKASGPNISFDFGSSFLIGGRLGVTLTFK